MKILCANCGDIIEEVDENYKHSMFEYIDYELEKVIIHTGLRCCRGSD